MKLSTLLLTTTALVVAGSAYAADLPAKKGAPAAKATGCPAFGAGFFQIPGGDNCLKIGGYVRSNNTYTTDTTARGTAPYSLGAAYDLYFDVRSNTDVGALKSYVSLYNTATEYAYVNVAGFTAGQFADQSDMFSNGINGGYQGSYNATGKGFLYGIPMGASTVTLGVVQAGTTWNGVTSSRPDLQVGVSTSAGPAALNVVAISHEAAGATSGAYSGYAVLGSAKVAAGPATVLVQGGVASGASSYVTSYSFGTTFRDASATSGEASTASTVGAKVSLAAGTGTLAAYGNTVSASGASGSTTSLTASTMGVQYAITAAKNLTVTPEVYQTITNTGSGNTTSNNVYLRIQRDF